MASTLRVTTPAARIAMPGGLPVTDLLLLLMALLWGVNFLVVKLGTQLFAPLAFNAARITLAVLVLWAIVLGRRAVLPTRAEIMRLLALGVLGNGFYQILFVEGLARTRPSDAALLLAASPVLTEVIGWMRGLERSGPRGMIGIALSLAGIGLVVSGAASSGGTVTSTATGNLLILGSCLCWALYSVFLKPFTERVDGLTLSAITMTGGLVPMLIVGMPALLATPWSDVGVRGWSAVGYSGIVALVIAYLFWYRGVRVLGPTRAAMYSNLQPLFAMAAAWLVLGDAPKQAQIGGAVLILSGLLLTRLERTARPVAG